MTPGMMLLLMVISAPIIVRLTMEGLLWVDRKYFREDVAERSATVFEPPQGQRARGSIPPSSACMCGSEHYSNRDLYLLNKNAERLDRETDDLRELQGDDPAG